MRISPILFVCFLAAIGSLTSLSIDMGLPATPLIEERFALPQGRGSLAISLFLAGFSCMPLVGGAFSDHFGRFRVLSFSLILYACASFACAFAPTFGLLLVFRFFQGCFAGTATTLPLAIIHDSLQGNIARQRMSEVLSVRNLMPILAPSFGSLLLFRHDWRLPFLAQAAFVLCLVAILVCYFDPLQPTTRRADISPLSLYRDYRRLLLNHRFRTCAIVYGLYFGSIFSFVSTSPLILMQRMAIAPSTYAVLFGLNSTGTMFGAWVGARLHKRKIAVSKVILAGLSISILASLVALIIAIMHASLPATILPEVFISFFGFGMTESAITLGALEELPGIPGTGSGTLRCILMIFGFTISGFLSFVISRFANAAELITTTTMTATAVGAALVYAISFRRRAESYLSLSK